MLKTVVTESDLPNAHEVKSDSAAKEKEPQSGSSAGQTQLYCSYRLRKSRGGRPAVLAPRNHALV
jgi:hypothetical protein